MSRKTRNATVLTAIFISVLAVVAVILNTKYSFHKNKNKILLVGVEAIYADLLRELVSGTKNVYVDTVIKRSVDPHEFEISLKEKQKLAAADMVLANGLGYDSWIKKIKLDNLVYASDCNVDMIENNPHIFFSVMNMINIGNYIVHNKLLTTNKINSYDKEKIEANYNRFLKNMEAPVALEHEIRTNFPGTPVEITESLPLYMLNEISFTVLTPKGFVDAITNGETPNPFEIEQVKEDIRNKRAKLLIYNTQNTNSIVKTISSVAKKNSVGIVKIQEVPQKAYLNIGDWYSLFLKNIVDILN